MQFGSLRELLKGFKHHLTCCFFFTGTLGLILDIWFELRVFFFFLLSSLFLSGSFDLLAILMS